MIAQQVLSAPHAAANASANATAAAQQIQTAGNGFLDLLSATQSSLTDLAKGTGGGSIAASAQQAAKKTDPNDSNATPYIAAQQNITPVQNPTLTPTSPTPITAPLANGQPDGAAAATVPGAQATDPNAAAAGKSAGNTNAVPSANTDPNAAAATNGSATPSPFGADELNARIAAAAPTFASQPTAAMSTVPAHLLQAPNANLETATPTTPGSAGDTPKPAATTPAPVAPDASQIAAAIPKPALTQPPQAEKSGGSFNLPGASADRAAESDADVDAATANQTANAASSLAPPQNTLAAPVQADAATHTAAPYIPVGEQVALNLKQAVAANNNEITIQLKPASLGTIDVKLNVGHDGRISAVITADRSDTLNMLKQDSGNLQQALRDAGLNADANSLSFNMRGDQQSFAQNSQQGGAGNSAANRFANAANDTSAIAAGAPATRAHAGTVNIEV